MEFLFFVCFLDFLDCMIFLKLIAHSWRSLWQSSGKVWRGYGKTVARLWQSYGKGIAKLWLSYVWPYIVRMRRTDARLRRTDAHNIKLYIYIYDDDGDGWIGWILDGEYACLSFFFGWVWGGSMVFG